jgi:hypothetical protein
MATFGNLELATAGRPTQPLEATLWRQACQILFALQFLDRGKPWTGMRLRGM